MAGLTTWNPLRSLARREDFFEDLFRDLLRAGEPNGGLLEPAVDIAEAENEVTVKLEVPGVAKENLQVSATEDSLTVRGETRKETEKKEKNYHRQEIRYGSFQRTVALPAEVDASKTTAELKNGMLTITLPKATQTKAKRVDVAVK